MNVPSHKIGFLFDLDGVLIDSENEYTKIWRSINEEFPSEYDDLALRIKGTTLSKILNEYYPDKNIQKKVEQRLHELENQMNYDYLPGVREFLEKLKSNNLPCALVTSSDDEKMSHLWSQHPELKNYFNFIVTGNHVKHSKPSPEGYLLGAEKINCDINKCFVFEDSLQGVMAGKSSGAFVIGVVGTLPKEILAPYSHLLISDFNEIDLEKLILIPTNNEQ